MAKERFLAFPKARRLTRKADFEHVKREGSTQRGKFIVLASAKIQGAVETRAGFAVGRHIGSAVVRNRVRRRLREIVRTHQHNVRQQVWIVLIAKSAAATAAYHALEHEWLRLAKRASILL